MSKFGFGIIDCVTNLFTPDSFERDEIGTDDHFRKKTRQNPDQWRGLSIEDYLRKMDRAGIEHSLLLAKKCGDMRVKFSVETPYERVYEVCQKYPDRFSGMAGCDPTKGMEGVRELERGIKDYGFVAAHLYPHWFGLAPDHASYYPIYAKCCELNVPMMMQVGNALVYQQERRLPVVAKPITLDPVAIHFPELILIGSHVGWPWHDEMIAMAWRHPNVYIALDAYAPKHWPASILHYINTYGQDKVLFGSDWPVIDPERAVNDVENHDFRPVPLRKMMRDNVIRVFGLEQKLKSTANDDPAIWEQTRLKVGTR